MESLKQLVRGSKIYSMGNGEPMKFKKEIT